MVPPKLRLFEQNANERTSLKILTFFFLFLQQVAPPIRTTTQQLPSKVQSQGYQYHPGLRIHKCSYPGCDKAYDRRQSLVNHEVLKHGRKRNPRPSTFVYLPVASDADMVSQTATDQQSYPEPSQPLSTDLEPSNLDP